MMRWIAPRNLVPLVSLAVIAAAAVFSVIAPRHDPELSVYESQRVVVEGSVVGDPDMREKTVRLTVQPKTVNGTMINHSKRVIVSTDRFRDVAYGDTIRASGILRSPEPFETETGRTFNYPMYLWAHGVSYEVPFADVVVVDSGKKSAVSALYGIKHALIRGIERAFPEPYAALAEGLLLGEKQSLGPALYDAFVASGVVHIIVLSGYNVALIIHAVLFVALRTVPRLAYGLAAVFVVLFTIATGASETTVRAAIMALFMMVARVLHRPALALRGLMVASALMALTNPFLVLYDLSFQLSVLATLGLILFSDALARRIPFVPERFGLREIIATTLATQITVLPLLILSIGAVSLVFLPANALVLVPIPLAMLFSFVAALMALAVPPLAPFIAFPAYLMLAYIIAVAEFFGTLPFALITIPPASTWAAVGALALVYGVVMVRTVLKSPRHSNF